MTFLLFSYYKISKRVHLKGIEIDADTKTLIIAKGCLIITTITQIIY